MKVLLTCCLLNLGLSPMIAQNKTDSIEVTKKLGTVFRQHGKSLKPRQLTDLMQSNPEAYHEMKIAKNNYNAGQVIGGVGGFLIGWPIGTAIGGGDPNWTLAIVGAGLVGVSIPFSMAYTRHAKSAVRTYNRGLQQTSFNHIDLHLGISLNTIGIRMTF